jgi:hypothetical protein
MRELGSDSSHFTSPSSSIDSQLVDADFSIKTFLKDPDLNSEGQ